MVGDTKCQMKKYIPAQQHLASTLQPTLVRKVNIFLGRELKLYILGVRDDHITFVTTAIEGPELIQVNEILNHRIELEHS